MAVNIVVPEVGESIVDARVAKWLKQEGAPVAAGDPLVELETDKIDLEVAATHAGVLQSIAHRDGADVKVGDVLGVIDESASAAGPATHAESAGTEAESLPAGDTDAAGLPAGATEAAGLPAGATEAAGLPAGALAKAGAKTRATPAARKVAEDKSVDLKSVKGSGDAGRVMRRDVEQASTQSGRGRLQPAQEPAAPKAPSSAPVPAPVAPRSTSDRTEERVRMSKRRATIAKRLVEVQSTAAMLTTFNEVDMSGVQAIRERHKQAFKERHGFNLGMTAFFVKALIGALRAFPRINAEIQGDEMILKHYYDIGIAVGAAEGLVVPVLRDADQLTFAQIEGQVREYARKADDGTLSIADIRGGTFTLTNGGVFGSLLSTPILNPPQVGILGLHAIKERPVGVNGQVVLRPMMYTALTYDHRIVDGAEAVRFLVKIKELIEDPGALLLE